MTSKLSAPPVLLGAQRPRLLSVPEFDSTTGEEAVELARVAGLEPDPWQEFVIVNALGEREDSGKWAAFEVGVEVSRQNGKGGVLEIRELAGLFLLGERLIIHSAHEFATSLEAFRRLLFLIENTPEFSRRVKRVSHTNGDQGIELIGGQRIRFKTRTKGGGRGFSADCLVLDEAMVIPEAMHGALLPTLSARPNPQVWYTGSAVDQFSMDHGHVFARVRARAVVGADPSLAYFGWSASCRTPDDVTREIACDPLEWAQANPGLGIRISLEHIEREQRSMDPRTFAVERLGVGDWPTPGRTAAVIDMDEWAAGIDPDSSISGTPTFALDVTPDRSFASIGVAGRRDDGLLHREVAARDRGTHWVVPRVLDLLERHGGECVYLDGAGPAGSLIRPLQEAGVEVKVITAREHGQAVGLLMDEIHEGAVRHIGQPDLDAAAAGAAKRPLGDAFAWSRISSGVDISPLVAVTIAGWAVSEQPNDDFVFEVIA